MELIQLVVVLVVIGVLLWALNTYAGSIIDPKILRIINIVVVVAVVLWILQIFGLFEIVRGVRVGPAR